MSWCCVKEIRFSTAPSCIEAEGLTEAAIYVERATLEQQRVLPLADVPENRAPYFSMILIDKGSRPGPDAGS